MDDGEPNKITSVFYDNVKDECGRLNYARAALLPGWMSICCARHRP